MVGWGGYEKKFVPLQPKRLQNRRMRLELIHGTAEDQSDMMKTTKRDERVKGRDTEGCGDPKTCCKVTA